ncbi:MAG: hypothetical protein HY775_04265 [Acidobacteria bacterium]|nr:hypothetical protein [Acidobacteriota bacterium]
MTPDRRGALIVEADPVARKRIGSWIGQACSEVLECPGPCAPDYGCIGVREGSCPLSVGADLVVLSLRLASDVLQRGTPGWQILLHYVSTGKRVVALLGEDDPVRPLPDEQVVVIARPPGRRALVGAARALLGDPVRREGSRRAGD